MSGAGLDGIGLDVGGTFLKAARVEEGGRIAERIHEPIAKDSAEGLLRQLASAVNRLDPGNLIRTAGVGVPGIVERNTRVRASPALRFLDGLAIGEQLAGRIGRRVFVENDANAAALAEAWIGAGRGQDSLLLVTLGTGVGAGLVLRDRIWSGRSGYAGELGHIRVDLNGVACACGGTGCLETVAGAPGWARRAQEVLAAGQTSSLRLPADQRAIVEAARAGDPGALEVVEGVARAVGMGIAGALQLLNIECVVLGGGVSAAGSFLLDRIVEEVRPRTFAPIFADCTFCVAALGNDAGVVGAARVGMLGLG